MQRFPSISCLLLLFGACTHAAKFVFPEDSPHAVSKRPFVNIQDEDRIKFLPTACGACTSCQLLTLAEFCCAVYEADGGKGWSFVKSKGDTPRGKELTECINVEGCPSGRGNCERWRDSSQIIFEDERKELRMRYHGQLDNWPLPGFAPATKAWARVLLRRSAMIMQLPQTSNMVQRWTAWKELAKQALVPGFTKLGFDVVDAPPTVMAKLYAEKDRILASVRRVSDLRGEGRGPEIEGPEEPAFIDTGSVNEDAMEEMLPIHAEWTGHETLQPVLSYGMRFYRNNSRLLMHNDRTNSHIISSVLHIGHEYDDEEEPWPLEIEDFEGNVHAVSLKPGQMLLYESAKCSHGRPSTFRGRYYVSLFTHYRPVDWSMTAVDVAVSIPAYWLDPTWDQATFVRHHAGKTFFKDADGNKASFTLEELRGIWDEALATDSAHRDFQSTGWANARSWFPDHTRFFHDGYGKDPNTPEVGPDKKPVWHLIDDRWLKIARSSDSARHAEL